MGDVYRGYEEDLDRAVAIKVLPAEFKRHKDFLKRFRAEAAAIAKLVHPNVVQIYFTGEDQGHHYFAMQYVDGETLGDLLDRRKKLEAHEALPIVEQCLAGLGAAHEMGLIHRDVKPGNILLDRQTQRALVADFGLVKTAGAQTHITVTGMVMGTADYIAPEQARGRAVDHRADIYAIGVMTYQMLAGRLPFHADSATAMMFQHAYEPPPPLEELEPDLPKPLAQIVMKLLAKEPDERYQSANDVLAELRLYTADAAAGAIPHTSLIAPPQYGDPPPLPADLVDIAPTHWQGRLRARLADWLGFFTARTPQLLAQWQNTQQQVDGAVAEYERRRDELAALHEEAKNLAAYFQSQAESHIQAASTAAERAETVDDIAVKHEALQQQFSDEQNAAELSQLAAEQQEHAEDIGFRLGKVDATLVQLRAQRNALRARLKVAEAQVQIETGRSRVRPWVKPAAVILVALVAAVVMTSVFLQPTSDTQPVPAAAVGPPVFAMVDLGPLNATAISDTGMLVGSVDINGHSRAVVWIEGRMIDLGTADGADSAALAVNNTGEVVGYTTSSEGRHHAFYWDGSGGPGEIQLVDIGTFTKPASDAHAINNDGWVVVEGWDPQAEAVARTSFVSWLWHKDYAALPIAAARTPRARDINDQRQVAGWRRPSAHYEGFIWKDGVLTGAGLVDGWRHSAVKAINNSGQAVGWVSSERAGEQAVDTQAFFSGFGAMGTLGGARSGAHDINDAGLIVGYADTDKGEQHAFLWRDGTMYDLNDRVPNTEGWVLSSASHINQEGQIVAHAKLGEQTRAFLLNPPHVHGTSEHESPALPVQLMPFDEMARIEYGGDLEVDDLNDGVRAFSDQAYDYFDVPDLLTEYQFVRTAANDAGDRLPFIVRQGGYVLATTAGEFHNDAQRAAARSLSQDGWTPTELRFRYRDTVKSRLQVWMKKVEPGPTLIPGPDVTLAGGTVLVPRFVVDTSTQWLFDGRTFTGWYETSPWTVQDGAIVCPTSSHIRQLVCRNTIDGPFELSYEIELSRLKRGDARGIWFKNANGGRVAGVRLNDNGQTFHIRSSGRPLKNVPLQTGRWYQIRCRIEKDGRFLAWLDGEHELETTAPVAYPLSMGLECERSGARFRNIRLERLTDESVASHVMDSPAEPVDAAGDPSENSVSITRITPDPSTALKVGDTVAFEVEIAYTLMDDSGEINLVVQRAERDGGIEAHLGGAMDAVSKGAGSMTLKKSIVIPDTQAIHIFTPLMTSQSTSTSIVDSRYFRVVR